jgi:peptidoglycan hydrolase CwlO-like protein
MKNRLKKAEEKTSKLETQLGIRSHEVETEQSKRDEARKSADELTRAMKTLESQLEQLRSEAAERDNE